MRWAAKLRLAWVAAIGILFLGLPIHASVLLNGVNIDGLTDQEFKNVRAVRIDAKGNVLIDAPAYQVEADASRTPPPAQKTLAKRYFLVTENPAPGKSGYDIDLFVNAKWLMRLRSEDEQLVQDISKHLHPGENRILFRATKRKVAPSHSPDHYFAVVVGEGEVSGDRVVIDNPLLDYRRTAAERDSSDREYTLLAR